MKIQHVSVDFQKDPVGTDTQNPLISWTAVAGQKEKAVSFRARCFTENGVEVWDSGDLPENAVNAEVRAALDNFSRYTVAVSVAGSDGKTDTSYGCFTTAFVRDGFSREARWITQKNVLRFSRDVLYVTGSLENQNKSGGEGLCHAMYFRRAFTAEKEIKRAWVSICGLGFYHLFVNGQKVGNYTLDPAQTDYHTGALYSTFCITDLLKKGYNAVLVSVGNGRHIEAYGYEQTPRLIAYFQLEYADGSRYVLPTDGSWMCSSGPVKENSIYEGEHYDARCRPDGWQNDDFDLSSWLPSSEIDGYPLRAQIMPPVRHTQTIEPREIVQKENGRWIIDFGQNMPGVVKVRFRNAPRGSEVKLHFSELLDETGDLLTATTRNARTEDRYICAGEACEWFEPSFTYHGFRYAELVDYPGVLTKEDVTALVAHTDLERCGRFQCTDGLLNRIHEIIQWSQRANVMSIPTDCPQREERMGWLGDMHLAAEQAICNYDMAAFYRKFLDDIRLSQREDGALSDVTPPYWPLYPADPAWGAAYATILWNLYFYYGDTQSLRKHFTGLKKYVDFLYARTTDGVLRDFGKYGDWCPPAATYPKQTPMDLTSSWFLTRDTGIVADIAGVLGNAADETAYRERFTALAAAFNRHFNNKGQYATVKMSPIDTFAGMTSQILPLALGIVPAEDEQKAVELLLDIVERRFDNHADCGIVGFRYLFPVLEKYGRSDLAYKLLTRTTYPSLGYMVAQGATTVWERWEYLAGMGMNSHNHIMFGSPDSWFYRHLCGIMPEKPRWETIRVKPYFPAGMDGAQASIETIRGVIACSWERQTPNRISVKLTIPYGVKASVELPSGTIELDAAGSYEFTE